MTDADLEWKMLQGFEKLWAEWSQDYNSLVYVAAAKSTFVEIDGQQYVFDRNSGSWLPEPPK